MNSILNFSGYIACIFLGAIAITVIVWIWQGKMNLSNLINEVNGQASMSRFQLLIFTFVIAISLFALVEKRTDGTFPPIPDGVLTLLGISASTYAVGKGISYSQPQTLVTPPSAADGGAAQASADQATNQATAAKDAAAAAQAAVAQIAGHLATVQQAVQQTANNAAAAQQAAAQVSAGQPVAVIVTGPGGEV